MDVSEYLFMYVSGFPPSSGICSVLCYVLSGWNSACEKTGLS